MLLMEHHLYKLNLQTNQQVGKVKSKSNCLKIV